ncbi:hypothetical protein IWZ01DRAFT_73607 [Phyllosticta capitalensis]
MNSCRLGRHAQKSSAPPPVSIHVRANPRSAPIFGPRASSDPSSLSDDCSRQLKRALVRLQRDSAPGSRSPSSSSSSSSSWFWYLRRIHRSTHGFREVGFAGRPDDDTQGGTCGSMRQRREAKIQQLHRFVLSCRCGASDSRLFRVCIYYGANPYPDPRTCVCLSGLAAEARCFFCLHVPCNQLQATAGLPLAALDWCNHAELARLDTIPHLLLPCIYTDPDLQTCVCLSSLAAEALRLSRLPGSSFSTFSRHFRRLAQKLACPPSRNQSRPMTPS